MKLLDVTDNQLEFLGRLNSLSFELVSELVYQMAAEQAAYNSKAIDMDGIAVLCPLCGHEFEYLKITDKLWALKPHLEKHKYGKLIRELVALSQKELRRLVLLTHIKRAGYTPVTKQGSIYSNLVEVKRALRRL